MDLQPYIDLGWWTVPLNKKLVRLENGKKSDPGFPSNWKDSCTDTFNRQNSKVGGVLTGPESDLLAIDCDSEEAYQIFRSLDPNYEAVLVSKGKLNPDGSEMKAGTILYKYSVEIPESHKIPKLNMDIYSAAGFIFLATSGNKTKHEWTTIPEIKEAPLAVIVLLKSLKPEKMLVETVLKNRQHTHYLYHQVKQLVETHRFTPGLFKIITPKSFRNEPEYIEKGYLHPDSVIDGRGHEYMSKVSAILGADSSINSKIYVEGMRAINELFSAPIEFNNFHDTIVDPMLGGASIDGKVIWQEDPNWEASIVNVANKRGDVLSVFFDGDRKIFAAVDVENEKLHQFAKAIELHSYLKAVAYDVQSKSELEQAMPLVDIVSTPKYNFGYYGDNEKFNEFSPTAALRVFNDPDTYKDKYNYPTTLLAYFESLIPDEDMRNYLFRFLRRKLTNYEYSPVVLYFLGVSGSGKDLFAMLLTEIMGEASAIKIGAEEFLEKQNGWVLNKYFVQLDEYGDQLKGFVAQDRAKGILKAMTGAPRMSVRGMRENSFSYHHNITFVMTSNTNPFIFDEDDRRIALFNTPNKLNTCPLVKELGLGVFVERMFNETNDFMYWLSTRRFNSADEEYREPPSTEEKRRLIASRLNACQRIAYLLKSQLFSELEHLCIEYEVNVKEMFEDSRRNEVSGHILVILYEEMTDGNGKSNSLAAAMRNNHMPRRRSTAKDGSHNFMYTVEGLREYTPTTGETITPIEGEFE